MVIPKAKGVIEDKCQNSDILANPHSNSPIIGRQRGFNHAELQVIISLQSFGIIPARL